MSGVIKKNQVRPSGPGVLPCEAVAGDVAAAPVVRPAAGHPAAGGAKARILEQRDGLAVIEITCSCGKTMLLNCETKTQ